MADFLQNNDYGQVPLDMGKKQRLKKAKKENLPSRQDGKDTFPPPKPEKDERFDFGGLPDRNLKKNLGCG